MKVVTAAQMRDIDKKTIASGIRGIDLMEHAGQSVFKAMREHFGDLSGKKLGIFCGKGNNGGDGLVVARILAEEGAKIKVILLAKREEVKGDARTNLERAQELGIEIMEVISQNQLVELAETVAESDIVVDAILGTGIEGAPKEPQASVISLINTLRKPVVSVDIPSGVAGSTGKVPGSSVNAALTVSFGLPKIGLVVYPGADKVGKLVVADIGIPSRLLEDDQIKVNMITPEDVSPYLKSREPDTHKGTYGHLLVIAGSAGMTGAAMLTSYGALRSGVGLVTLGIPQSLNDIMEVKLTEGMTLALPETRNRTLSLAAQVPVLDFLKRVDAVALGPGLSIEPETVALVKNLTKEIGMPMVIDADGLNALAGEPKILRQRKASTIITPHPGELAKLTEVTAKDVQADRIKAASEFATEYNTIVILKGARTIVADSSGQSFINPTGNPGMASGGVGDVLTGMVGSGLAQGMDAICAAKVAVYVHGLAGDMIAREKGEISLIAGDLLEKLPSAFKKFQS
jgi:NAD(P)H-hydrate epimerase